MKSSKPATIQSYFNTPQYADDDCSLSEEEMRELRGVYNKIAREDNVIDRDELMTLFAQLGIRPTKEELEVVWKELDIGYENNSIQWPEFERMMKRGDILSHNRRNLIHDFEILGGIDGEMSIDQLRTCFKTYLPEHADDAYLQQLFQQFKPQSGVFNYSDHIKSKIRS